jgi:hypothetical protein
MEVAYMKRLDAAELAWAMNNPEIIREVMSRHVGNVLSTDIEQGSAINWHASKMRAALANRIAEVEANKERVASLQQSYQNAANSQFETVSTAALQWADEDLVDAQEHMDALEEHLQALRAKSELATKSPEICFLPLGTVVTIKRPPAYRDSRSSSDERQCFPANGTVGVVTKICVNGEFFLGVSVTGSYITQKGEEVQINEAKFHTFRCDPDMLTVIGYSTLPDRTLFKGYDFQPTHNTARGEMTTVMLLEYDGVYWRYRDFGGAGGTEAIEVFTDISDCVWIGKPLMDLRNAR